MHTFSPIKVGMAFLALALLPVVVYAGQATPVVAGKSAYSLPLFHGAGGFRFSDTETSMAADLDSVSPPEISITIVEPSGAGPGTWKWQTLFDPLSAGDEFVVQGRLYRVARIDEGWLGVAHANGSAWKCKQKPCVPSVDVVMLPQVVLAAGRNALVVPRRGPYPDELQSGVSASLYTSLYGCFLDLYFDGLKKQGSHGYIARMRSKLDAFYHQGDISNCHEQVHTGRVDARVGDTVNFGDFGHFKVESIWPADAHHKAWVVLVPAKNKSY